MRPRFLAALTLCCMAVSALAADFVVNGIYYYGYTTGNKSVATVKQNDRYKSLTSVALPKTVTYSNVTYTVTHIAPDAFRDCTQLKTVTLPDSLVGLYDNAFSGCTALSAITIPKSVWFINKYAFYKCSALKTVTLSPSLKEIGEWAFGECASLTAISIPATLTTLPNNVFDNCTALKSVSFPSTLLKIGTRAFGGCTSLSSVIIPESVTRVEGGAFAGCTSLTKVTWNAISSEDTNGNWYTYDNSYTPFQECPALKTIVFGGKVQRLPNYICHSLTGLSEVTIPASVTYLGRGAFANCGGLKKVTYNAVDAAYSMGSTYFNLPFYLCDNLTTVTFGSDVESIPAYLLMRCKRIKSITVPAKVKKVGGCAFAECDSLSKVVWNAKACAGSYSDSGGGPFTFNAYLQNNSKNITTFIFGEGVEEIPAYLCYSMPNITTCSLPSTLKSIGNYAFYGCSGTGTVNLPASVTTIGEGAFSGNGLTTLNIPPSVTTIGSEAFSRNKLTTLHIPASLTNIGYKAFYNSPLESITVDSDNPVYDSRDGGNVLVHTESNTVVKGNVAGYIPNSIATIGDYAYDRLTCETIDIPASVKQINSYAFATATVKSITIPASVSTIWGYAFDQPTYTMTNVETIKSYIRDPSAIKCLATAFNGIVNKKWTNAAVCRLLVPAGTEQLYGATEPWNKFAQIDTFNPADLNGDNVVNTGDVSSLYNAILTLPYSTEFDLNADGVVNASDVSTLYDNILGQ